MLALLGALLGFVSSAFPELLRFVNQHRDRIHELAILEQQLKITKLNLSYKLDQVRLGSEFHEQLALIKSQRPSSVRWIDGLAGSVRPVITYAFFILYALIKVANWQIFMSTHPDLSTLVALTQIWTGEDEALFAAVMSFWFGHRALTKRR